MDGLNPKKICFISCVNQPRLWEECCLYLEQLYIPEGFETEVLTVTDAASMTSGYNEAMRASDARYKIYLHQDLFLTDRYILQEMVDSFLRYREIGILGVVGSVGDPEDGIMWNAGQTASYYWKGNCDFSNCDTYTRPELVKVYHAGLLDGMLLMTSRDLPWREDLLTRFDFYDASHCMEFRRRGLGVGVIDPGKPVCVHQNGYINNYLYYEEERLKFMAEYGAELHKKGHSGLSGGGTA